MNIELPLENHMSPMEIATHLVRLERLCEDAYEKDSKELAELVKELGLNPLQDGFPFLFDAIRTQLFWLRGIEREKEKAEPGVYVICYGTGAVKIGKTIDFKKRLQALSSSTPHRPSETYFQPTSNHTKVETAMHKHFKEHRMNGEFFRVDFAEAVALLQKTVLHSAPSANARG